jgi:hypothetical protein
MYTELLTNWRVRVCVQFYLMLNVAAGGIAYFPDAAQNPGGKPWTNNSPQV